MNESHQPAESYCLNPLCPKPIEPLNASNRLCRHCGCDILLQGRYRVIRLLGEGGFSKTFEIDDRATPKVLKVLLDNHPKAVALFQQEARVLSQLRHPGIPKIEPNSYFTIRPRNSQQLLHCLIMEKIEGVNLETWMSDRNDRPISEAQAVAWLKQIASILHQVHQQDYFHRDIKPSNIMLRTPINKGSWGDLALIDFGTVREISGTYLAKVGSGRNVTGIISTGYTPLEQANGKAVPQSDFYALGRTFVYLLTGRSPNDFAEDPHNGELQWRAKAPQISDRVADFIDRLMAPFPGNRPQNTELILHYLAQIEQAVQIFHSPHAVKPSSKSNPANVKRPPVTGIKPKNKTIINLANEFLAVNAALLVGFVGTQVYDYLRPQPTQLLSRATLERAEPYTALPAVAAEQKPSLPVAKSTPKPTSESLPIQTFSGHLSQVRTIAFSRDGQILASGSGDGTIKLWQVKTGQPLRTLSGHLRGVNAIALSPDGKTLASGSGDNTIKLWDVITGQLKHTLIGHSGWVSTLAFSPDGNMLASGSFDNTVKLWDVNAGQIQYNLKGHSGWVFAVAFSPDGETVASGSFDNTIKLWDAYTSERRGILAGKSLRVRSLAFSPDGQILASGSGDGRIELWDLNAGELHSTLAAHGEAVKSLSFSPDGQTLASSANSTIELWNWRDKSRLKALTGHENRVDAIAFSPNGQTLASGSDDKTIKIWSIHSLSK